MNLWVAVILIVVVASASGVFTYLLTRLRTTRESAQQAQSLGGSSCRPGERAIQVRERGQRDRGKRKAQSPGRVSGRHSRRRETLRAGTPCAVRPQEEPDSPGADFLSQHPHFELGRPRDPCRRGSGSRRLGEDIERVQQCCRSRDYGSPKCATVAFPRGLDRAFAE